VRNLRIENTHLINLANNTDAVAKFPFLEKLRELVEKGGPSCGCGGKQAAFDQAMAEAQVAARNSIIALTPERLMGLKKLMGADKITIYRKQANGAAAPVEL
jgi:hypothetical protein